MLGQVIHGYRIEQTLAADKGGFGDVFFATHVDSGAEAVVKVLKPEMSANRDIVARFFNEARAAASVHHPGIVQIHNVGYHGDRAYLLMERLRGDDLEGRLARGPLPIERAILFMRQAAGAVGAAHDRGIIHRDLKPANLFVVADPDVVGGERVKVLDFGIAKLTADAAAGKTQGVFGTPAYMSPEQCASTAAVDARADLYSLGCIFYELVCGRPPFGHGGLELIAAHLRDIPTLPRAIAPWVPPAIEQVILRLLEKQPERRLPSCAALIAALDEATAVSGLTGASAPQLPMAGPGFGSMPPPSRSAPPGSMPPTTLGGAVSAVTAPPQKRGIGLWLGLGAVVVVAGVIAVVVAMPGRRSAGPGGSDGSGSAGSATVVAGVADAGAAATPDAASVAVRQEQTAVGRDDTVATKQGAVEGRQAEVAEPKKRGVASPEEPKKRDAASSKASKDDAASSEEPKQRDAASAAEVAAQLNEQGRKAMSADDYEQARRLFSQAVARDPQAKYFVNVATADLQLGQLEAAADALRQALRHSPTPGESAKVTKQFRVIAREAKVRGITLAHPITPAEMGSAPQDTPAANAGGSSTPAGYGSQAEIAARLNEEGKELIYADKYNEAARKFQEAVARVPEPKYFINLCVARFQTGEFDLALTACRAATRYNATPDQQARANKLIAKIREEAEKQGLQLHGP